MSSAGDPEGPASTTHIIGLQVTIGGRYQRQRCAWCGEMLEDLDLGTVAVALNPDGSHPGPPAEWPIGRLVRVEGTDLWRDGSMIVLAEGAPLPDDACAAEAALIAEAFAEDPPPA